MSPKEAVELLNAVSSVEASLQVATMRMRHLKKTLARMKEGSE